MKLVEYKCCCEPEDPEPEKVLVLPIDLNIYKGNIESR